jgi:hypothetical protein
MGETRPFASLSSGLLARKGAAKPAMRPHAFGHVGAAGIEDLGWDDMGEQPEPQEHVPSSIAGLTPAPRPGGHSAEEPAVREQQRTLAESFGAAQEPETAAVEGGVPPSVVQMPVRRAGLRARDKAAFTLRLDPERHFRLRLACAVTGRSAQQIVTGALDQILDTIPELDALAGQLPVKAARQS